MVNEFKFRVLTSEDWKDIGKKEEELLIYSKGLRLKDDETSGVYSSNPLESGIPGCRWHRIVLDANIPDNSTLTVSFYASDKEETAKSFIGRRVFKNANDALVEVPPGRYLSLKIEFHREGKDSPVLKNVKIYYQRFSYLRYLPAVYQENSKSKEFLDRFISIFESALYDSEETITDIPCYFDPLASPPEFYRWLASWLSLDLYELLQDRNREFILRAVEFYKQKGTAEGIASLVSFLTGKKCCVKEYMNNVFRSFGMEHKEAEDIADEWRCANSYHRTSDTVDTDDAYLIAKMGEHDDRMHYTIDTSKNGRYSPKVIELFIFLPNGEELKIDRDQLLKIINSFLPVFVRAKINIVEVYDEKYYLSWILDEYSDMVHGLTQEQIKVRDFYKDHVSWKWLCTWKEGHKAFTNDLDYRTVQINIDAEQKCGA